VRYSFALPANQPSFQNATKSHIGGVDEIWLVEAQHDDGTQVDCWQMTTAAISQA
jgi:hypothetical protein